MESTIINKLHNYEVSSTFSSTINTGIRGNEIADILAKRATMVEDRYIDHADIFREIMLISLAIRDSYRNEIACSELDSTTVTQLLGL